MPMTEIFQHVRAQYESKPRLREAVGPGHPKVVARDDKWFITELLDKWKVDYERRKRHHHTGYFALNYIPYKTFASLKHTDAYDLLGDHLGILMNRQYAFMQLYSRNQPTTEKTESHTSPELHNTIVVVCDEASKNKKVLPPSRNGGLTAIRAALSSDIQVLRDVAAGISFREALLHKADITDKKGPSEGNGVTHTNDQQAVCTEDTEQAENIKTIGPNLYVALAAAHFKSHTSSGSANKPDLRHQLREIVNAKRTQQRHAMAKLKSIYAVLCCLYNIKSRDLKNQEPLSYSVVKALAMKPLHSPTKHQPHHFQHHLHVDAPHHPPSSSPLLSHRHSLGLAHSGHRGPMASRHVKLDDREYLAPIETWEELLDLHGGSEKIQSSSSSFVCSSVGGSGGVPTANINMQRQSRMGSSSIPVHTHQTSHKILPPWQRQVVFVKNKDDSLRKDPAQKLQDCFDLFHNFKSEMSQNVKSTLENREYQLHMQKHLLTKLEHLDLGANMHACLERMRNQAYLIQSHERAEERNKPVWFALLEKEIKATFDAQDKEASMIIEKLRQFIHIDIDAIPHVMEKMCLLVMSLPASQLSIQPVMSAIEFVLEHVLKQSPKLLTQLKNLRQLPPVTTELQSSRPIYVFGYRV